MAFECFPIPTCKYNVTSMFKQVFFKKNNHFLENGLKNTLFIAIFALV